MRPTLACNGLKIINLWKLFTLKQKPFWNLNVEPFSIDFIILLIQIAWSQIIELRKMTHITPSSGHLYRTHKNYNFIVTPVEEKFKPTWLGNLLTCLQCLRNFLFLIRSTLDPSKEIIVRTTNFEAKSACQWMAEIPSTLKTVKSNTILNFHNFFLLDTNSSVFRCWKGTQLVRPADTLLQVLRRKWMSPHYHSLETEHFNQSQPFLKILWQCTQLLDPPLKVLWPHTVGSSDAQ